MVYLEFAGSSAWHVETSCGSSRLIIPAYLCHIAMLDVEGYKSFTCKDLQIEKGLNLCFTGPLALMSDSIIKITTGRSSCDRTYALY